MNKQIKGLSELLNKLEKLKGLKENPEALLAGAFVIETGAKERVAVDTGFLKSSITSEKTDKGAQVRVDAEYAYIQEYGSSTQAGTPYIRPTIDEDEGRIVDAIANQLQKQINDVARGGG